MLNRQPAGECSSEAMAFEADQLRMCLILLNSLRARQIRCRMVEPASFGRQTLHPPRVPWSVLASEAYKVGRALRLYHNYRGLYSQSIVAAMFVPYEIVDISPP